MEAAQSCPLWCLLRFKDWWLTENLRPRRCQSENSRLRIITGFRTTLQPKTRNSDFDISSCLQPLQRWAYLTLYPYCLQVKSLQCLEQCFSRPATSSANGISAAQGMRRMSFSIVGSRPLSAYSNTNVSKFRTLHAALRH